MNHIPKKTDGGLSRGADTSLAEERAKREADFTELLGRAVARARATGEWASLTLGFLGPESKVVKTGVSLTYIPELRRQGITGWYSVIERYGNLTVRELELVRQAAQNQRRQRISVRRRHFSNDELTKWVADHVTPVVLKARESGRWELIMRKHWEAHTEQVTFCGCNGLHDSDWYGALLSYGVISSDEAMLARNAAQSERTRSGGRRHRKFTAEDLTRWFKEEIEPRIGAARRGGDWGELMLAAWRGDPHFGTITQVFGQKPNNWYGVLARLGGVSPEEQALIRKEGELARVRKRETPELHSYQYGRGSKIRRQIVVVEKLVLGNSPRHKTDFRSVINKLREMKSARVTSTDVLTPERTRAVLEVKGGELLRDQLSPADQLRLLFPRIRGELDWSFMAERYQNILPSLSSYLANRAALLYINSLADAGTISFPKKALSVGSGTGDLYDAYEELEPMLAQAGQIRPAVTDLDFSRGMLRLSRNPDKVCSAAISIPLCDGSYDLVECSSPYRMGSSEELRIILGEAHRVVRPNGLLWLKADGVLFSDSFVFSLEKMGFDLIAPANCNLNLPREIVESLDSKLRQRSLAALRNTHFIFAIKSSRLSETVDAVNLTFMRQRTISEDVEQVQALLKGLLRSASDSEYIINARTFVNIMSTLAPETFDQKGALAVGLLHKYLGVLFTDGEIGTLPVERDITSLHKKLVEHQSLVDMSLSEADLPGAEPDPIVLYVREMKRAVDHLEHLAAHHGS